MVGSGGSIGEICVGSTQILFAVFFRFADAKMICIIPSIFILSSPIPIVSIPGTLAHSPSNLRPSFSIRIHADISPPHQPSIHSSQALLRSENAISSPTHSDAHRRTLLNEAVVDELTDFLQRFHICDVGRITSYISLQSREGVVDHVLPKH